MIVFMKILIQRVTHAHVEVEGKIVGSIGPGALVFIGTTHADTDAQAIWLANKLIKLRMFEDDQGKINKSLLECNADVLVVSQFTLYADCSAGRRPSFIQAGQPDLAKILYETFIAEVRKEITKVEAGIFGASMKVSLLNDGPFTLMIERL